MENMQPGAVFLCLERGNSGMDMEKLWESCVAFHGHRCGGLAIGFAAARYAGQLLGMGFSPDEQVVCVAENDACGVDAIQVVLGCSAGKGNLLFRRRGKQVFTFFCRETGKGVRLALKPLPPMEKEEKIAYLRNAPLESLFDLREPDFPMPERARLFSSAPCARCGEMTAEPWLRVKNGEILCLDCYEKGCGGEKEAKK